MATIKDIAREAGVSHATVSNVLNRKGNVSAKRIKLVLDAAEKMGYRVNEAASALRGGGAQSMAVIMPDIAGTAYADLYLSICREAKKNGYSVVLRLTENVPQKEKQAVQEVLSLRAKCVVVITCLPDIEDCYAPLIHEGIEVLFALRGAQKNHPYAEFDGEKVVQALTKQVMKDGSAQHIALMTDVIVSEAQRIFVTQLSDALTDAMGCTVYVSESCQVEYSKRAFGIFERADVDTVITTREEMARAVQAVGQKLDKQIRIYTLGADRLLGYRGISVCALDYCALGTKIAAMLTNEDRPRHSIMEPVKGFLPSYQGPQVIKKTTLSMLTADTPAALALERLLPCLHKETGIDLHMDIRPSRLVRDAFTREEQIAAYDLVRIDLGLIDYWAKSLLLPLDETAVDSDMLDRLLPGVAEEYGEIDGIRYAMPFDPGCHLLFYREDIFDNIHYQRSYFERFRKKLEIPRNMNDYRQVAGFLDAISRSEGMRWRGCIMTGRLGETLSALLELSDQEQCTAISQRDLVTYVERQKQLLQYALIVGGGSWNEAMSRFASGEGALMIAHINYAGHLRDHPLASASGRTGYAQQPGTRAFLGGGSLGVVRRTRHAKEASVVLRWLAGKETSSLMALLSGCAPWKEAYERQELLDIYPWLPAVREGLIGGTRRRLFALKPGSTHEKNIEVQIADLCASAVAGTLSCAQAAERINRLIR